MKNLIIALVFYILTLNLSRPCFAQERGSGFFVEPGVSYEFSSATIDYPGPFTTSDGRVYGLGLFARLGFHFEEMLFGAFDARYSRPTFKDTTHSLEASANSYNFALLAGVQTPVAGLRLWASYVFAGGINPEVYSNSLDMNYTGASGFRVGAGLYFMILSLNLEYQSIAYDTTVQALGPFAVNTSFAANELTNNSFVLSVSFPIFSNASSNTNQSNEKE